SRLDEGLFAWDGEWYLSLAERWYGGSPRDAVRFFPLFPGLGRVGGWLLLGEHGLALVLIASAGAFVAALLIQALADDLQLGAEASSVSPWILALFPGAFVLSMSYAEGLWLPLVIGALLAMRRQRWWWVAALGLLGALTRPLGVLLAIVFVIEAFRGWRSIGSAERMARLAAAVAPIVGLLVFLAYCATLPGGWREPLRVQSELRGGFVEPFTRTVRAVADLFSGGDAFADGLHAFTAVALVALVIASWRLLPVSLAAYTTVAAYLTLAAENLNSLERYTLNIVPVVLVAAALVAKLRAERLALVSLAGASACLATLAFVGAYVP
ncbi:MAG TPA: hypothetical protein VF855_14765, partial [Acidimicrobiales bacterium]